MLTALAERRPAVSHGGARDRTSTLSRTRLELMLKVLDVDGAVQRVAGGWVATGRPVDTTTPSATTASPRPGSASSRRW